MEDKMSEEQVQQNIRTIKRIQYIALGILVGLFVIFGSIVAVYLYQHSFSPERWTAQPEHRARMVGSLLEKHDLVGMTEEEITTLLGEDDTQMGYFQEENRMVYCLGSDGQLFPIDNQWLLLDFDEGRVEEYSLTMD